jgi:2'-5' RNA ligase
VTTPAGAVRWVIVILLPPTNLDERIRRYRQRYDPLAAAIAPHVTLVHPFLDDIAPSELQDHLARVVESTPPFRMCVAEVTPFPDGYIYLNLKEGNDTTIALRDRLYGGPLAHHKSRRDTYVPHVTIGRAADEVTMDQALADAGNLDLHATVTAKEITAYCCDDHERRHIQFTVPLGG